MRIIVTRPEREAIAWTAQLQARGYDAVALPLIAIGPAPGNDLRQRWDTLNSFDAVMFVSSNAAQYFFESKQALGACRAWGVESENRRFLQNRPQRGQFLPDLQPNSSAIRQKDGEKWTAAADLQPTFPKSDRLLWGGTSGLAKPDPRCPWNGGDG